MVTQAFEGMGGVGKTELAIEYAYRHLGRFNVVWWVACEGLAAVPVYLDQLAIRLELPGDNAGERLQALDGWFTTHHDWLIIADNVADWETTRPLLPQQGDGALIVTTRQRGVHPNSIPVDVFTPTEAQTFVSRRLRQTNIDAVPLGELLGRLPLALEQACSYMLTTGSSLDDYQRLFETRAAELLQQGDTGGHEGTVAVTFSLSLEQAKTLAATDRYAVDPEPLATLLAFLAADNVPLTLLDHIDADH